MHGGKHTHDQMVAAGEKNSRGSEDGGPPEIGHGADHIEVVELLEAERLEKRKSEEARIKEVKIDEFEHYFEEMNKRAHDAMSASEPENALVFLK